MRKELSEKLRLLRKDNLLVVVDFAGTLFALGPDKNHIKDDFIPEDATVIKGAVELDPSGCLHKKLKPFQKGVEYGWTVIPSVARLLRDIQGVNIIASSVADKERQVSLQKAASQDNHIRINHIMTKDAEAIVNKGYRPSTVVVLGDTSKDIELAERIAELSPHAKVVCGFTPSGMEKPEVVQTTLNKQHPNITLISGENWSIVVRQLRKIVPIKSQNLYQFKKIRKRQAKMIKAKNIYSRAQNER
ncbi:MAG: hypothetical protein J6N49_06910 [Alphaproteobacteria bacterium]|nr:hypothetical protein [Alphaproteobacteria bacterium]